MEIVSFVARKRNHRVLLSILNHAHDARGHFAISFLVGRLELASCKPPKELRRSLLPVRLGGAAVHPDHARDSDAQERGDAAALAHGAVANHYHDEHCLSQLVGRG